MPRRYLPLLGFALLACIVWLTSTASVLAAPAAQTARVSANPDPRPTPVHQQ